MAAINWQQPWLAPFGGVAQASMGVSGDVSVAGLLNKLGPSSVRFVPQASLQCAEAYEAFIARTGSVPTRDNLHDFFNGLCWLQFPQTKKRLNQLQAAEIARDGVQQVRGPLRDALTLFDENAAFLLAPTAIWEALEERDWRRLFIDLRPLWAQAQLVLFGHALLEKLIFPRKAVTAHVYRGLSAINSIAKPAFGGLSALDAWTAADLDPARLATKPFLPLPVLGVPGWWAENENFSFYDDSDVFRPRSKNNK